MVFNIIHLLIHVYIYIIYLKNIKKHLRDLKI